MPLYAAPRTGVCCLTMGDTMTLFDGTETPVQGMASIPFARATSPSGNDGGTSFLALGMASDMVIDIQVANENIDANYVTVQTITADASGEGGTTDLGRSQFYRALISVYTTGTMPTVTASR